METELEELQAKITEIEFNSRWDIVAVYHEVGKLIISQPEAEQEDLINTMAYHLRRRKQSLRYMAKFATLFPKPDSALQEGKNISWEMIVTKYLREPKDQENCDHQSVTVCRICRKVIV